MGSEMCIRDRPNMDPSWLQVASSWAQVGSNLLQVGPMLEPDPGPQLPLSQPKPFQTPSLWPLDLPNPHLCPTRPNIDSKGLPNLQLRPPQPPTWTPKDLNMAPKGTFPGSKSYCPGPAEWGVASLNIYICIYV